MRYVILLIGIVMLFGACAKSKMEPVAEEKKVTEFPSVKREFRCAWVATVANIDWPSRPGLPSDKQKEEMLAILDKAVSLNMNAIILQVRPQCDALYESSIEPWSYYLTGEMGKPPEPLYDPLKFAIQEAHKRGMELHTWFNPYRANHPANRGGIHNTHISVKNPAIVKQYGKFLWLDPGEKDTQDHTMSVILDVVQRYDVDGVHIDDYFYPYKVNDDQGKVIDFPDDPSFEKYKASGGALERADWRRENVNSFVKRFYTEVKAQKPWVKVGISPFGIWRPGYPEGIKGLDQYEELYADAKLWLERGWVDYFTPQLYWAIDSQGQPYKPLLKWWVEQNKMGRHIWPGNYTSRVDDKEGGTPWKADEILSQIKATREQEGAGGNVHFSMVCLMENRDNICDKLKEGVYKYPALVPATPWLSEGEFKETPTLNVKKETNRVSLTWNLLSDRPVRLWVLSKYEGGTWYYKIIPDNATKSAFFAVDDIARVEIITISAVDQYGLESPRAVVNMKDVQ